MRIGGWRYPRHVRVEDDTVAMEIARTHCSHCPTCSGRIVHCRNALGNKPFNRESAGGGEYFVLPYPADRPRDPESIASFLSEELQLSVTPCG
jgi:hypothetical protein